jgi:hypothetical protein
MNLSRRIEELEKTHSPVKQWHRIICIAGEEESAINQFCEDKGITREALEGPSLGLIIRSIVEPRASSKNLENGNESKP